MENWYRVSKYYPGCDGCNLAVDLYRPLEIEQDQKIPAVLYAGYYPRRQSFIKNQAIAERLLAEGYAVIFVEPRGVGASFGRNDGFYNRLDGKDIKNVIDLIAEEEWCSGNVGMFGGSNYGMIQLLTASEVPQHLRAIIPNDNNPDFYYQNFPNGVSALPYFPQLHDMAFFTADPVDDDPAPNFPMAAAAMKEHESNGSFLSQYQDHMFRDTVVDRLGYAPNMEIPAWERVDEIRASGISVYFIGSWHDTSCTGAILAYKNFGKKLLIGPWTHCQIYDGTSKEPNSGFDWISDHVRFFDATLRNADNGILTEPDVQYYTLHAKPGEEWRRSADWPPDQQALTDLYLGSSRDNAPWVDEEGYLTGDRPAEHQVEYKVDLSTTLYQEGGKLHRRIDRDLTPLDHKSITFTSEPLQDDIEITGMPSASIWITSSFPDGVFVAVLEEVMSDGTSHYVTDGAIRASHAKTTPNSAWDSLGLPYHGSKEEDAISLSSTEPTNLVFHLEAISYEAKAGNRLRVSIFCAEKNLYKQPVGLEDSLPDIKLWLGGETASFIRIPIIKSSTFEFHGETGSAYAFRRAVFLRQNDKWDRYPVSQSYEKDGKTRFVTDAFTAVKSESEDVSALTIFSAEIDFCGFGRRRAAGQLNEESTELKKLQMRKTSCDNNQETNPTFRNVYLATVAVEPGKRYHPNIQPYATLDLLIDIALPDEGSAPYPCIINIHGYGGTHHMFYPVSRDLLMNGYAVASIDYRMYPPNTWPSPAHDAKAAIRFLKANAEQFQLDADRFGVIGASAGGHLTAMIAADNGNPLCEGDIGGNETFHSGIKAAAAYFPWTDIFTFGDHQAAKYPNNPEKALLCDGPFAPLGCLLGFSGEGKGIAELKKHMNDQDPNYRRLIQMGIDASSVSHVTQNSAPCVFVHGIFEYGVQIPMQQSIEMFEEYTKHGVKSLLLCNNNGEYGEDPEVKRAVLDFLLQRV